jgi:hypothetical protein
MLLGANNNARGLSPGVVSAGLAPQRAGGCDAGVATCLVAILVALIGASPAQAVSVKVTIVGADGKPVKGASVSVSLWRGSQPTHEDGLFISLVRERRGKTAASPSRPNPMGGSHCPPTPT